MILKLTMNELIIHLYSASIVLLYTQSALQSCGGSLLNHHAYFLHGMVHPKIKINVTIYSTLMLYVNLYEGLITVC